MRIVFDQIEFNKFLGLDLISQEGDRIVGRLTGETHHLTGPGRIHGGVIMAFADALAAHGAMLNLADGQTTATIESKTNFLRRAKPGELIGEALPLHIGRKTMVWQTTIRDQAERCLAVVTQTQIVLDGKEAAPEATEDKPALVQSSNDSSDPGGRVDREQSTTAERRRAQIFEAALGLISKNGFANTSMREIAKEAGMPVPTMYQYVRSKDEILEAIFDSYVGEIESSVQASSAKAATATEKLIAAIDVNLTGFDRYQSEIRVMNRETASLRPEVRSRVKQHMMGYIGMFREIIAEGVERGEFRPVDAELTANLLLMLCETWPLRQWSVGHNGISAVKAAIQMLTVGGLSKEAAKNG